MARINILDLGINNLSSITKAFQEQRSSSVAVIQNSQDWVECDLIILPGVGAFGAGMESLTSRGFVQILKTHQAEGRHIAGVCLGMQLLCKGSSESPGIQGLGMLDSTVEKLPNDVGERVPHMGWNNVNQVENAPFFSNSNGRDFYFVHSYALLGRTKEAVATTIFGNVEFTASILKENVAGFQFHPEKSSSAGKSLIADLIAWVDA